MPIDFPLTPLPPGVAWPRPYLTTLLQTAVRLGETRFARQIALGWLAAYPGDLSVELLYGWALYREGHTAQARKVAEKLCARDPEYLEAQELLAQTQPLADPTRDSLPETAIFALGGLPNPKNPRAIADWAAPLQAARRSLQAKDLPRAEASLQAALAAADRTALTGITHLQILRAQPDTPWAALQSLAAHYRARWPMCVQFKLLLAEAQMDGGEPEAAVALLHEAAAADVTGQAAARLWGEAHPYRRLWPQRLAAVIDEPIPARVAAALGWNLLGAGASLAESAPPPPGQEAAPFLLAEPTPRAESAPKGAHPVPEKPIPETLRVVEATLEQVSKRLGRSGLAEGRFPMYVILSTRRGLRTQYGGAAAAQVAARVGQLAARVRGMLGWGALVFWADDPACTAEWGVKPAPAEDAWALKLALADLDAALAKKGMMIGAVLIVGGPEVVPFHALPNPTDDADADTPSDNPYATRDENYFVPMWPVGRLPGGEGNSPDLLLAALDRAMTAYARGEVQIGGWRRWWNWLRRLWAAPRRGGSVGFSAEVWQKAARMVYRSIGEGAALNTSPPVAAVNGGAGLLRGELGYFNLHGLADDDAWYGQRDPANGSAGPDYPVALRAADVPEGGQVPAVIFSEACYGAHIRGKRAGDSLALRFLAAGSRAVIGSTVMAYGSIRAPLNAADLLAEAFWRFLRAGSPAGEALMQAKIHLAGTMHARQGYLDGEDQKTLISFVLYGDPLAQPAGDGAALKVGKALRREPLAVKTVCDRLAQPGVSEPISAEILGQVKQVVAQYLPGMQGAAMVLSHEHAGCDCSDHCCPTGQLGAKVRPDRSAGRKVVTLNKAVPAEGGLHPMVARLTFDAAGKVVKLAVSR